MSAPVNLSELQGNILCGYRFPRAAYLFCRVDDAAAARAWLGGLAGRVTTAESWGTTMTPGETLNVALSWAGLRALGLPPDALAEFPPEFSGGMAARAEKLGDIGEDAPESWEGALDDRVTHVLVTVYVAVDERAAIDAAVERARPGAGLTVLGTQYARGLAGGREHFGFSDGLAQPAVADPAAGPWHGVGTTTRRSRPVGGWEGIAPGEFVLGYTDEDAEIPSAPAPFAVDASYMVVRKLHQHVDAWYEQLDRWSDRDPKVAAELAARIVGRWTNGTPVSRSPDAPDPVLDELDQPEEKLTPAEREDRFRRLNDFSFGDDLEGSTCPLGSHIRRANPRDSLGDGRLTRRHRIIRRGMPYGDPPEDPRVPDDAERGLMFICLQASISRQFELIQADWLGDGDSFGLGSDPDLLVCSGSPGAKMHIPGRPGRFLARPRRTVTLRGGGYFIVPSVSALRRLAALNPAAEAESERPATTL